MHTPLNKKNIRPAGGFTLIEIIAVLATLGVLAAMAAMAVQTDREDLSSALNTFRANLRYAQALGVAQSHLSDKTSSGNTVVWGLSCEGTSYTLQFDGDDQDLVKLPGSSDATISLPEGVQFSSTSNIHFNYRGQPMSSTQTLLDNDLAIKMKTDNTEQTVTVVADTGFVQ